MTKSLRFNSEIRYLIANTYIKTLILLLIREMKIIPFSVFHLGPFSTLSVSMWLGEYDSRKQGEIMTFSRKLSD